MKMPILVPAFLCLSGLLCAVQVEVPLPGLCGYYPGDDSLPVSVNFDCGTTFKQIDQVYIRCSGWIIPGLGMICQEPWQLHPIEGEYFFYMPAQPYSFYAGVRSYGSFDGSFTQQVAFRSLQDATFDFLLDGKAQIDASMMYIVLGISTVIYPPTGSIRSASLVIEGIPDELGIESPRYFHAYVAGSMQSTVWIDYRDPVVPPRQYNVEFSSDDGQTWSFLNTAPVEIRPFAWQAPAVNSQNCRIRVSDAADPDDAAISPAFTVFTCAKELPVDFHPDCYINWRDFQEFSQQWLAAGGLAFDDLIDFADAWLDCGNLFDPLCL